MRLTQLTLIGLPILTLSCAEVLEPIGTGGSSTGSGGFGTGADSGAGAGTSTGGSGAGSMGGEPGTGGMANGGTGGTGGTTGGTGGMTGGTGGMTGGTGGMTGGTGGMTGDCVNVTCDSSQKSPGTAGACYVINSAVAGWQASNEEGCIITLDGKTITDASPLVQGGELEFSGCTKDFVSWTCWGG